MHIFFTLTKDSAGTKSVLGNRFFPRLSLVGRCCAVFFTAVHLATTREGGLGPKSPRLAPRGFREGTGRLVLL